MNVLVAYASRHGATQDIAERIARRLGSDGLDVCLTPIEEARKPADYDAFVIGSAVYMFHWLKDATKFVRRNQALLAERPTWLFSSGPLGTETTDKDGRDLLDVSRAKEVASLAATIHARDDVMFYGAWTGGRPVGIAERFVAMMPAARNAMPVGDFRDWATIEAWAASIARELLEGMKDST